MSAFWRDAIERVAWSFAQGVATAILAAGAFDLDTLEAAVIAGGMAAFSAVKVIAARKVGNRESAAIGV